MVEDKHQIRLVICLPRLIRLRDAPAYLGIDKNVLNALSHSGRPPKRRTRWEVEKRQDARFDSRATAHKADLFIGGINSFMVIGAAISIALLLAGVAVGISGNENSTDRHFISAEGAVVSTQ